MITPHEEDIQGEIHKGDMFRVDVDVVYGDFETREEAKDAIVQLIDSVPAEDLPEDDDGEYEFIWRDFPVDGLVGFGIEADLSDVKYVAAIVVISSEEPDKDAVQELIEEYLMEDWND
ncbi:hypothetical protein HOT82_gp033 [Gordonia phage Ronaldo]|uniref:Uncharacterized protein n=3 Tax=Ronaldovirus ronaldo TaxID=2734270 RepID=A0A6B9LKQ8_9CAUD|nr:hypothetical protein HOT82_gp033 [Gordonia phage Ronaldo]AXN53595.1 hypothetical protein SEA_RONALDO_33 [Gordonia phage Ronaldo]QDH48372.1 hypothetical protein SEA_ZIKO_33 [Gordonia phage Ziko]QHB38149.1 hypothetical protein SEA_VOLT_32 [Gordonia phage Volt]